MPVKFCQGDLYPLLLALTRLAKSVCYVPKNVKITTDRMSLLKTLCDICARVRIDENSSWTEVDILCENLRLDLFLKFTYVHNRARQIMLQTTRLGGFTTSQKLVEKTPWMSSFGAMRTTRVPP